MEERKLVITVQFQICYAALAKVATDSNCSNLQVKQLVDLQVDSLVTIVHGGDLIVTGSERGMDFLERREDVESALLQYCNGM